MAESAEQDDLSVAPRASLFGLAADGLNALGSILILGMTVLICADVLVRNVTGKALPGVTEVVAFAVVMIVFLQIASSLRHQRFSRADIFIGAFVRRRPTAGRLLLALFDLLGAAVAAVLCVGSWPLLARAWSQDLYFGISGVFTAPEWPMRAAIVVGTLMLSLQYIGHAWARLQYIAGRNKHSAKGKVRSAPA